VVDLAAMDTARGLAPFFANWHESQSMDKAVRATFGITLYGFEKQWQSRTRRRYGALALVSDVTLAGLLLLLIIFPLYVARRRRDRERMAALVAADVAAEKAARESVLEALLRGDDGPDFGDEKSNPPTS
jgi:hypothetical protein